MKIIRTKHAFDDIDEGEDDVCVKDNHNITWDDNRTPRNGTKVKREMISK